MKKPEQPCSRDCARRKAGCAADCPDWERYIAERSAYYAARHRAKEDDNAARKLAINQHERRMKEGFE